jgi:hypothetical protein
VASLLERVARGERAAFAQCVDQCGDLVWSLSRRMSPTQADAEDATLEIFLGLWGKAARYDATRGSEVETEELSGEKLPAALRDRILAATPISGGSDATSLEGKASAPRAPPAKAGWWAAAACLLLAISGWWPRLTGERTQVVATRADPRAQRDEMLAAPGVMRVNMTAASDVQLTGDVVFDPASQVGFLRFRGIPANDPRLSQYQLWIADGGRDQPQPVDGGVFDVPQANAGGDVVIPFRAKLPIGKPSAFVVTLEQPGGVVVSKQERVLALAKVL